MSGSDVVVVPSRSSVDDRSLGSIDTGGEVSFKVLLPGRKPMILESDESCTGPTNMRSCGFVATEFADKCGQGKKSMGE